MVKGIKNTIRSSEPVSHHLTTLVDLMNTYQALSKLTT